MNNKTTNRFHRIILSPKDLKVKPLIFVDFTCFLSFDRTITRTLNTTQSILLPTLEVDYLPTLLIFVFRESDSYILPNSYRLNHHKSVILFEYRPCSTKRFNSFFGVFSFHTLLVIRYYYQSF
jgi:hypothetical protein